ncbi:hypothetical protein [Ruegeria atlantica]|uniref:Uncharacterized protein n=1 Tax=Ruegeria atlantica TaxID=81569 RepID=A0A0N7LQ90_9RHOB|nr:hypothetical protein [Ruegeria atlantica]CUH47356.1 hypothetical protein RUA4292_01525 [Ruegeria atlantica]
MDYTDWIKLAPLAAALVLARGVYHTNRRWEDQKLFERIRDEEKAAAARRSLAASLLAELIALHELVTKNELAKCARAQVEQEDCAFHIPIRDREVIRIGAVTLSLMPRQVDATQ